MSLLSEILASRTGFCRADRQTIERIVEDRGFRITTEKRGDIKLVPVEAAIDVAPHMAHESSSDEED